MRINRVKLISELAQRDLTQIEFAKRAGVSRSTVSQISCGKSCSYNVAMKIAKCLGMKLEDIIEGGGAQ